MDVLSWIVLGFLSGLLAKLIMPGKDPGGFIITTLLGIAGALVGGFLGSLVGLGTTGSLNFGSVLTAVAGALVLLYLYRKIKS